METSQTFGRYRVERVIGKGAMGTVYRAVDPRIDRVVAIKTVSFQAVDEAERQSALDRFHLEARLAGKLAHPNIVTIYDVGENFIAMEFLEGESLASYLKRKGPLPLAEALAFCQGMAAALDHAHSHGIIHRDVKPANILLSGADHKVKLTDFGIAKGAGMGMTATGHVLGTPNYMAPEQVLGEGLDARSDLFSLAVVCYEMLSGKLPFGGDSLTTVAYKIVHTTPPPIRSVNPTIPAAVEAFLSRALAKNPEHRFSSGHAFMDAFRLAATVPDMPPPLPASGELAQQPRPARQEPAVSPLLPAAPAGRNSRLLLWLIPLVLLLAAAGWFVLRQKTSVSQKEALLAGSAGSNGETAGESLDQAAMGEGDQGESEAGQLAAAEMGTPAEDGDLLSPMETPLGEPESEAPPVERQGDRPTEVPPATVETVQPKPEGPSRPAAGAAIQPAQLRPANQPAALVAPPKSWSRSFGDEWGELADLVYLEGKLYLGDIGEEAIRILDPRSGRQMSQFEVPDEPAQMTVWRGQLYVAIPSRGIARYSPSGVLDGNFGKKGVLSGDFKRIRGLASDGRGGFWLTDSAQNRLAHIGMDGHADRLVTGFKDPGAILVSPEGQVLVLDRGNHRILGFSAEGQQVFILGGQGKEPGKFSKPSGLSIGNGWLAVCDQGNRRIQFFSWPARGGAQVLPGGGANAFDGLSSCLFSDEQLLVVDSGKKVVHLFTP
jgi:serine/threonine-protein kinase